MIRWTPLLFLALFAALPLGCGGEKAKSEEPLDLQYARSLREAVLGDLLGTTAQEASPLKQRVNEFVENLGGYKEDEMGEYAATYNSIVARAKELQKLVNDNAPKSQIDAKLKELKELAEKLPEAPAAKTGQGTPNAGG